MTRLYTEKESVEGKSGKQEKNLYIYQ